jgi:hypothetical protein
MEYNIDDALMVIGRLEYARQIHEATVIRLAQENAHLREALEGSAPDQEGSGELDNPNVSDPGGE